MCTLILAWQVFDEAPVVAAANRDEALGRPSRPPRVLDGDPPVVAPQDTEAGGTWIGYSEHGVFVAITNRRADLEGDRSRGLLVRDALGASSAATATDEVRQELDKRTYAGFNLVLADGESATLLEWDGTLRSTAIEPGIHVVVNDGYDGASEKATAIRTATVDLTTRSAEQWLDAVQDVLVDHDIGACIHRDGYGTRSSSLVTIRSDGRLEYQFADGPPCENEYRPVALPERQV